MKSLNYFRYWFFITRKWDIFLAFFTIYYEIKGERKYRLNSVELDMLKTITIDSNNLVHASIYQGCNYYILEKGFNYLKSINENNNLVDFGCGKGRAMVVAAYFGFKKITGIDFARPLCLLAEQNIKRTSPIFPETDFKIICDDVVNYSIDKDHNVFFFFNPFDEVVMLTVVKNILFSLKKNPRKVYIMYSNPVHKEIFLSAGFGEIYYLKKLEYLELSILISPTEEDLDTID
jgi:hypothetical protein